MIKALRGMKDLLGGEEAARFTYVVETAGEIARKYGFEYAEAPILEETALFKRSVGESSDIVGKEMYQFTDKGDNDVCMRPEGTAGIVRAFVEKKMDRLQGQVGRFFYYGPMFRYERPQKGRLRQFHQFGAESFGEAGVYEDLNIILMIGEIFDDLGIAYDLEINSLGCLECTPDYRAKLTGFLENIREELCEDCRRRIETNPMRVLDCKNPKCQELLTDAHKITDNLCTTCDDDFSTLKSLLEKAGVKFKVNKKLVRGLDYYTKTAFEFVSTEIGAQSAIAGGGRYDRLVEFLGGKPTPAVGFALGIERILELVKIPDEGRDGVYMGAMGETAVEPVVLQALRVRKTHRTMVEYAPKSLKAHLKAADKFGARLCAVVGENELANGEIWVKDLEEKKEYTVKLNDFGI